MTLQNDLQQFTGTEKWYRVSPFSQILITDGVKYFADKGGAYWAVNDIIIAADLLKIGFLVATITSKDGKATIEFTDGNEEPVNYETQKYPYTDLEQGVYKFYVIDNVMLLPGEY